MFHREGYRIIAGTLVFVIALNMVSVLYLSGWPQTVLTIVSIFLLILILQFFRNPKRSPFAHIENVLSPVDGKVVVIEEVFEEEYFKDKRLQISVFMSPINVHVTRYPIGGKIKYSQYHPGKYLVAWHPKSSQLNERTTVVVQSETGEEVLFRQIAGAMARRIVNYAKPGEQAVQGEDSGFIKFGSRVDVLLPIGTKIEVELNQKVKGAESVLAKFV